MCFETRPVARRRSLLIVIASVSLSAGTLAAALAPFAVPPAVLA